MEMSFVVCGPSKYRYLPKTFEIILGGLSPPRTASNRGKAETWQSTVILNTLLVGGERKGFSMFLHQNPQYLSPMGNVEKQ